MGQMKKTIKSACKRALALVGIEVRRARAHDWTDVASFIPFEPTLKAAAAAELSVGDYIDGVMNKIPGATQATIDGMKELGVFAARVETVLEIGPGSGRYLEKTLAACSPKRYEFYETANKWAGYVEQKYGAIRQPTSGSSLAPTPTASVDLVQAHKVFSGLDLLVTLRYWAEMTRVVRPGGAVVFDVVTERCLDPETITRWIDSGLDTGSYPSAVPRESALGYFAARGLGLVGSFLVPMGPGTTEVLVFRKR
jgi:SAM-dependent methyltransferase